MRDFLLSFEHGDLLNDLLVGRVPPEFAGNETLHACLDGGVDDALLDFHFVGRKQENDRILTFEGGQELFFRVAVVHSVDFDVGWKRGR